MPLLHNLKLQSDNVYFVGDLHGQYQLLLQAMQHAGFDPSNGDVLVSTGDLVDRGPQSMECLSLLDQDWFYTVKGNHEQMLLDGLAALAGNGKSLDLINWRDFNGGDWYQEDSPVAQEVERLLPTLTELPLAIEIETELGRVGVIHAAVPNNEWLDIDLLQLKASQKFAMWSRSNGLAARRKLDSVANGQSSLSSNMHQVQGIDAVVVGHTIMPQGAPALLGNTLYLDVGCAKGKTPVLYKANTLLTQQLS